MANGIIDLRQRGPGTGEQLLQTGQSMLNFFMQKEQLGLQKENLKLAKADQKIRQNEALFQQAEREAQQRAAADFLTSLVRGSQGVQMPGAAAPQQAPGQGIAPVPQQQLQPQQQQRQITPQPPAQQPAQLPPGVTPEMAESILQEPEIAGALRDIGRADVSSDVANIRFAQAGAFARQHAQSKQVQGLLENPKSMTDLARAKQLQPDLPTEVINRVARTHFPAETEKLEDFQAGIAHRRMAQIVESGIPLPQAVELGLVDPQTTIAFQQFGLLPLLSSAERRRENFTDYAGQVARSILSNSPDLAGQIPLAALTKIVETGNVPEPLRPAFERIREEVEVGRRTARMGFQSKIWGSPRVSIFLDEAERARRDGDTEHAAKMLGAARSAAGALGGREAVELFPTAFEAKRPKATLWKIPIPFTGKEELEIAGTPGTETAVAYSDSFNGDVGRAVTDVANDLQQALGTFNLNIATFRRDPNTAWQQLNQSASVDDVLLIHNLFSALESLEEFRRRGFKELRSVR